MDENDVSDDLALGSPGLGGLTIGEMAVMENLIAAWNAYKELPGDNMQELQEVRTAVHVIQAALALRVVRRLDPEYWS